MSGAGEGGKHTSGPWVVHEIWNGRGSSYSVGREEIGSEHTVAKVYQPGGKPSGTNAANAHLIAAAPDMLAALRFIADREDLTFAECSDAEAIITAAKEAIAKAEGPTR